jgi:hypothetical protein
MPIKIEFICKYNEEIICEKPYKCWECGKKDYILAGLKHKEENKND